MKKYLITSLLISTLILSGSLFVFAQDMTTTTVDSTSTTLNLGQRIRNMINGVLKNRPTGSSPTTRTKPSITKIPGSKPAIKPNATLDVACVKAAIAKRDSAIGSAWSTKSTQLQAAFALRSTQLQAAWDIAIAKDRNDALKKAWKTFQETEKSINKTFIEAKNALWKTYKEELKSCGTKAASYDIPITDEETTTTTTISTTTST